MDRINLGVIVTQFGLPNVPTFEDVDIGLLEQGDDDPMYVTLQIAEVGAVSKDGLIHDDYLVGEIERQIRDKRNDGLGGHLSDDERATSYPMTDDGSKPFAGVWIGAQRVGNELWAKAYIPPGKVRQYLRIKKASKGLVGTSIYGTGVFEHLSDGKRRVKQFVLETLDFAPDDRAAISFGGEFAVTKQIVDESEETEMPEITLTDVPETVRQQIIKQADLEGKAERVAQLEKQLSEQEQTIAEMRTSAGIVAEIRTILGSDADVKAIVQQMHEILQQAASIVGVDWTNLSVRVEEMHEQVAQMQRSVFDTALDTAVIKVTDWQVVGDEGKAKLASLRAQLKRETLSQMGDERKPEAVEAAVKTALEDKDFQVIAEMVKQSLAGPGALSGGKGQTGLPETWETDIRQKFNVGGAH
ncbi:MAG: hypothetical protein K8L99_13490 [Anaerolineae bacterium]|nr:hypothetical protein [Anaerolineae bacterium]